MMQKIINIFYMFFIFIFSWLLANIILNVQTTSFTKGNGYYLEPEKIYNPIFILFLGLFFIVLLLFINKKMNKYKSITSKKIFIIIFIVILAFQIVIGVRLRFDISDTTKFTDLGAIIEALKGLINNKQYVYQYFSLVPYQKGIVVYLFGMYKFLEMFGISSINITGILLNIISIDMTIIICFLICKKLFNTNIASLIGILSIFFTPYFTYIPYYYTDTLSMPYTVLFLYLFILKRSHKKSIYFDILLGIVSFIGISIRITVGIVPIACLIFTIIEGLNLKKIISIEFIIIILFIGDSLVTYYIDKTEIFPYKLEEVEKFPITHYISMGLYEDRYGAWNQEDANITMGELTTKRRAEKNIETIIERMKNFKTEGYIKFLTKKATWIWGDGTYFAIAKLCFPHKYNSVILNYIIGKKNLPYRYISQTYQVILIFFMIMSAIKQIYKKMGYMFIVNLSILGVFIFSLIWEARSRYLLNLTPMFFISAIDGISFLLERTQQYLCRLKKKRKLILEK